MKPRMSGFKVFEHDWTYSGKQYKCPGVFKENMASLDDKQGISFCKRAIDCFYCHSLSHKNRIAEVIAFGDVVEVGNICYTNKIKLVREVSWEELLQMVNYGQKCSGFKNIGDMNIGDKNIGNNNKGHINIGNDNEGHANIGYDNKGNKNIGNDNKGDKNNGNHNIGNSNNGCNNIGDKNNGDDNKGNKNSGDRNLGDKNSGNDNEGDGNSGDWNKCNFSNGCFNTTEPKIYLFNQPSRWSYNDWLNSNAKKILDRIPKDDIEYGWIVNLIDNGKINVSNTIEEFPKKARLSKCRSIWWKLLSDEERYTVEAIPNFDEAIFKEITGIDIEWSEKYGF